MKQQIALFGYPLSHSISPAFQQAALDSLSIEASYTARPTRPEELASEVDKLRADDHLGANVTIPHKELIRQYLDGLDPWAETVGAVNTIVKKDGRLVGHNTDGYGFLRSLEERGGFAPEGKSVLLLGAGGAARAAVFALAERGAGTVLIANRTVDRGDALAADVRGRSPDTDSISRGAVPPVVLRAQPLTGQATISRASLNVGTVSNSEAREAARRVDLIVNATSMGMEPGPNAGLSPLDSADISPHALVYDMVYTPQQTPLMKAALQAGAKVLGGLWMLVYQGAAAFEMWTSREAPVDLMYEAGLRALGGEP